VLARSQRQEFPHAHGTIAAELAALNLAEGQAAAASAGQGPDPERAFSGKLYSPRWSGHGRS